MKTVEAVGKNSCELLDRVERGPPGMVGASHTRVPPHAAIALVAVVFGLLFEVVCLNRYGVVQLE